MIIAQPQLPTGLPLAICLTGAHRQQGIGAVTLGGRTQLTRILGTQGFLGRNQLFAEIGQWQAQRQTTVLGRFIQRLGGSLAVTDERELPRS